MYSPTRSSASTSPTSPTHMRRKPAIPPGFRAAPKPKPRPISELTVRELRDIQIRNAHILSSPGASTSTYVHRISAEQAAVEARLLELDGMDAINTSLKKTKIISEDEMLVDPPPEPPSSRTLEAKRKALSQAIPVTGPSSMGFFNLQEAMDIERKAHQLDRERREHLLEKKKRLGIPINGEVLTRKEREARILAFMNHKPTESDLEDDSDDEDDEDPSTWFEDDQDDGRKGQDIVEPDVEDLADIIRVDEGHLHYSTFYTPREEGD